MVRDAAAHAGVGLKERVHAVLVARQNHHQVVALVLHHLQQDLDRLLPVVALVLGAVQVVGLVDEQHAAHRLLQHFLGLGRGVAYVLAHQVVARDRHQMPFAHIAQAVQDGGHAHGHRGLAGAGVPGERHVQRRRLRGEPQVATQLVDHQQRGDVADACLDRRQADQVAVQFGQHVLDLRLSQHLAHRACSRDGLGHRRWRRHVGWRGHAGDAVQRCVHGRVRAEVQTWDRNALSPARGEGARTLSSARPRACRWRSCAPCSASNGPAPPGAPGRSRVPSSAG